MVAHGVLPYNAPLGAISMEIFYLNTNVSRKEQDLHMASVEVYQHFSLVGFVQKVPPIRLEYKIKIVHITHL